MTPRASRIALIVASVPDETSRTMSMPGTASTIRSASSTSRDVGAPNDVPRAAAAVARLDDLGSRVPEQQRSPRLDVVHVSRAVDVDQERALASLDEPRGSADRPERAHRGVDASGDDVRGAREELVRMCSRARWYVSSSVQAELVAFRVLHRHPEGAALVQLVELRRAERDQLGRLAR